MSFYIFHTNNGGGTIEAPAPTGASGFNGFRFPIMYGTDDNPIQEWDGVTFFSGKASNSDAAATPVVGPGTEYPIGFTRKALADLVWLAKSFRLNATGTSYVTGILKTINSAWSSDDFGVLDWDRTTEEDLTTGAGGTDSDATNDPENYSQFPPSPFYSIGTSCCWLLQLLNLSPRCYFHDDLFWPRLVFTATTHASEEGEGIPLQQSLARMTSVKPGPIGDYTETSITFLGESLAAWETSDNSNPDVQATLAVTSVDVEKYWPWNPIDNHPGVSDGPVWNEDTGAKLREPLTVASELGLIT